MSRIVVGVDGSKGARDSLVWAAREGELRGWDVTAVLAWGFLDQYHADLGTQFDPRYSQEEANLALRSYIDSALGADRGASIHAKAICDLPARALLEASSQAGLLVVGARGFGGVKSLVLGSVSRKCLHHTTNPIAIVREIQRNAGTENTVERIVVGIDGSENSREALDWGIQEARARQAELQVLLAWEMPLVGGSPYTGTVFDPSALRSDAQRTVDEFIGAADTEGLAHPLQTILHPGDAASGIVQTAKGADLVVVGSRGLGGFKGLLLGSVGHYVVHKAPCPVVVIPQRS